MPDHEQAAIEKRRLRNLNRGSWDSHGFVARKLRPLLFEPLSLTYVGSGLQRSLPNWTLPSLLGMCTPMATSKTLSEKELYLTYI